MIRIFQSKNPGPRFNEIILHKQLSTKRCNNKGVFWAEVSSGDRVLQNVVAKVAKGAGYQIFYRVNGLGKLGLGAEYYGWGDTPMGRAMILSHVPGVDQPETLDQYKETRYFDYHTPETFNEIARIYELLLDANIIVPSLDYLIDPNGYIGLIDHDGRRWIPSYDNAARMTTKDGLIRLYGYLRQHLRPELLEHLDKLSKLVMQMIESKE